MASPERPQHSGDGILTASELFDALRKALLGRGKYLGDAYYLFGPVDITPDITGSTQDIPGRFRLEDYCASETYRWVYGDNGGADPEQQSRLLASGHTVLTVQLYPTGSKTPFDRWYSCFRPSDIRQGDGLSATGDAIEALGISYDTDDVLVMQEGSDAHPRIADPQRERQLQLLYQAVTEIMQ